MLMLTQLSQRMHGSKNQVICTLLHPPPFIQLDVHLQPLISQKKNSKMNTSCRDSSSRNILCHFGVNCVNLKYHEENMNLHFYIIYLQYFSDCKSLSTSSSLTSTIYMFASASCPPSSNMSSFSFVS